MISLHYTSHTKAYNTIYTACNIVEAIYSFTPLLPPERQHHATLFVNAATNSHNFHRTSVLKDKTLL